MRNRLRTALPLTVMLSAAIATALFYYPLIAVDQYGDFEFHAEAAAEMAQKHRVTLPHFFFHFLTVVIAFLAQAKLLPTAIALAAVAQGSTCLLLIHMIRGGRQTLGLAREIGMNAAALAGVALSFVGPLSLFTFPNLYLGYPGISCAHNPTIILLRPFALGLFMVTLRLLSAESWGQWRELAAAAAALLLLGGLTKPSYNVCLAPALALFLLFRFRRDRSWSRTSLATFVLLAASISAITLWQIKFTFGEGGDASVVFAPLKVMSYWNHESRLIALAKLALSLAFPIFVAIAYRKTRERTSDAFLLSWLATAIAILSAYGFDEGGVRTLNGNFTWSMQICLLILMAVSLAMFLAEEGWFHGEESGRFTVTTLAGSALFLLHFLSGLIYVVFAPRVS